jgi:membrane fusion protein (multidrug efflux system)
MFVRATVQLGNTPNAFLVPQRAVTRNAAGKATAFFVGEEGKVEARVIETGRAIGNDWLVTAGVGEGDRVVVDGLQKISDGTAVTPVEVAIDADGVVRQEIAAPQATPQATPRAAPQADGASQ